MGLASLLAPAQESAKPAREAPKPFTCLFDTGSPSATTLPAQSLAARTGWVQVPEDKLEHKFAGDAVLLNDKLVIVLRKGGAEVYSRTPDGPKDRAVLRPLAEANDPATSLSAIRIAENTQAAVALEATFRTVSGKVVSARYRITTGMMILDVSTGDGAGKLLIEDKARYVIVPDFFAYDTAFDPKLTPDAQRGLPTENMYLSMLGRGEAILTCVWQGNERNADVIVQGKGQERSILGVQIDCLKGKGLWIALLDAPGIWHEENIRGDDPLSEIAFDWQPCFPAKWRGVLIGPTGEQTWMPRLPEANEGKTGGLETNQTRSAWRVEHTATLSRVVCPQLHFVVYPIDRGASTPLASFCPIDVMRNTLGVGPCQYVLDVEGMGDQSQATADEVTRWVEQLFEKKEQKEADAIRQRLKLMVELAKVTEGRLGEYAAFAGRLPKFVGETEEIRRAGGLGLVREIERCAGQTGVLVPPGTLEDDPVKSMGLLTDAILALVGKGDALGECRQLCGKIRAVDARQHLRLSYSRANVRRVKQLCRIAASDYPQLAEWARKVQKQAEEMLKKQGAGNRQ